MMPKHVGPCQRPTAPGLTKDSLEIRLAKVHTEADLHELGQRDRVILATRQLTYTDVRASARRRLVKRPRPRSPSLCH